MPHQHDLNIDNLEEPQPATTTITHNTNLPRAANDPEDPWGLSSPPPKAKKKKGKKNGAATRPKPSEEPEYSSSYPKSMTPSPPAEYDVKTRSTSPPAQREPVSLPLPEREPELFPDAELDPEPEQVPTMVSPPLVSLDSDTHFVEDHISPITLPNHRSSTGTASPVVRSPRSAAARPVPALTAPNRPARLSIDARDRGNSVASYQPAAPVAHPRRESFVTHTPHRPRLPDAPLPHLPQPHFFGLPDLGLFKPKQETGKPAGSEGYCCRFDSFATAGDDVSARKAKDALLVGCEGGLDVFRILPSKLEVVGRLEGLRGAVIGAKILPHTEKFDYIADLRPLVAVVVHGPIIDDRGDSGQEGEDNEPLDPPAQFQTTVEVFSLAAQRHVCTLYSSAAVDVEQPTLGQVSSLPDPVGDLHLDAQGRFVTVSSGNSGEVFIFTQSPCGELKEPRFRCIGKFWTSIQELQSSRRPDPDDRAHTSVDATVEAREPLCSLSQRWLAIVPPVSSTNISIQGTPLLLDKTLLPPGCSSHAAPPQPAVTCEVIGTDTEGTWSRLGRQAAQSLVKYSQRGLEFGLQGWKELTQPSPPSSRQVHERHVSKEDIFPPTKAPHDDPGRFSREPALVSIVDLEDLRAWEENRPKYLPLPMATFALVGGCSFLSLSCSGSKLLSANRNGAVSTVWDLSQAAHGVPKRDLAVDEESSTSPSIKQLQQIARNSPSTILDCAWSRDDDTIAILTAHGTVHLHEVPSRPRSRMRKPRNTANSVGYEKADATVSLSSGMSPPSSSNAGFLGSIKSGWQTMSTQVNTIRSTNPASAFGLPTTFAGFREVTAAAGNAGSRAVARSLSQGYTAAKGGASDYWHADDNKIRHTRALQNPSMAKSLIWIRRNNTTCIAIACGGTLYLHSVQRVSRRKGDTLVTGLKHERSARKAFPLPNIVTKSEAGGLQADPCAGQGPHGFWILRHSTPTPAHGQIVRRVEPRQTSDVETNPPYCPFHVESRVSIFAFEEMDGSQYGPLPAYEAFQRQGHGLSDEQPWVFGEQLPQSVMVNDRTTENDHDSIFLDQDRMADRAADDELDVADQMESKLTIHPARNGKQQGHGDEQIRINTRRRHGNALGKGDVRAEEGFDLIGDDDDESII